MLKYKILILISLCFILLFTNNCTLIGLGIGSVADSRKNNEYYTINKELFSITPGTKISLITTSGDTLVGNYQSTTNEYSQEYIDEYNDKYNSIRAQLIVPRINDTLVISNSIGKTYKYIFLSFDNNTIYVGSILSENKNFIKLNSDLKFGFGKEQFLDQYWIINAIKYKTIPIMSKMNIKNNKETHSIFYHQIQKIQTKSENIAAYIILAGVTIDLLILKNSDFPFFLWSSHN